mmetsp:Transcript_4193/g.5406  ORF Transcript_4193/g.5406 Transcript_4193/m.5406 type:complete len:298 (-) Transcript_4193:271-1164(-)
MPKFSEQEVVFARDQDQLYKAKILKITPPSQKKVMYFIHYMGWNTRWDKWVSEDTLMKDGDEAKDMQKKLKHELKNKGKKVAEKRKEEEKSKPEVTREKKKAKINSKEDKEDDSELPQIKLPMPFTLKKQLVDDWEFITQEPKRLVPVPREPTAADVMKQFLEMKERRGNNPHLQRFQELIDGLRIYFDKALPLILLYRQEREQYEIVSKKFPDKSPSEIFGPEHLLRLFVRLPTLLAQTSLSPQEVNQVQSKLGEFLRFLQKNHENFFLSEYEIAESKPAEDTKPSAKDEPVKKSG